MILYQSFQRGAVFHPLAEQNHNEHRRHDEIETCGIKRDQPAEERADQRPGHPIHLVEKGNDQVSLAFVDPLGNRRRVDNRKGLVTGRVDQIKLFRPHLLIRVKKGNPVK